MVYLMLLFCCVLYIKVPLWVTLLVIEQRNKRWDAIDMETPPCHLGECCLRDFEERCTVREGLGYSSATFLVQHFWFLNVCLHHQTHADIDSEKAYTS